MRARMLSALAGDGFVFAVGDIIDGEQAVLRVSEGLAEPVDDEEPEQARVIEVAETATSRRTRK